MTEPMRETTALINEFTALNASFILAYPHLSQLNLNHATMTTKGHISDSPTNVPIDRSLLAGQWVHRFSSPVTLAMNDDALRMIAVLNLIDPLPFYSQNLCWDANAHRFVLYEVVRDLIFQQLIWVFGILFHS
jgi:hypothetical protein